MIGGGSGGTSAASAAGVVAAANAAGRGLMLGNSHQNDNTGNQANMYRYVIKEVNDTTSLPYPIPST